MWSGQTRILSEMPGCVTDKIQLRLFRTVPQTKRPTNDGFYLQRLQTLYICQHIYLYVIRVSADSVYIYLSKLSRSVVHIFSFFFWCTDSIVSTGYDQINIQMCSTSRYASAMLNS